MWFKLSFMIKKNSKSLKNFSWIFISNLVFLFLIAGVISSLKGYQFKDVLFVEGILVFMVSVLSSIDGKPLSLSLQEFGQVNPQYFASIVLESNATEKERIISSSNISIKMDIVSTSIMIGSIIVLIISYLL